jgi:Zn-dependent protease
MAIEQIFFFIVLIPSIILHEIAHGHAANMLGDPTARLAGRLTLNPISHIDLFGSIILPILFILTPGNFILGWAKPVPYNPYNFQKGGRWGEFLVAGAGPATNVLLAAAFTLVAYLGAHIPFLVSFSFIVVYVNILLAFFNLIPIPPLDGSKILSALLPPPLSFQYERFRKVLEYNPMLGFGAVILFIILFGGSFFQFIFTLSHSLVGI